MIRILNDDSPMPLGRYRSKKMEDVPADYLLWYEKQAALRQVHERVIEDDRAIRAYTRDNMDVLLVEQKRARRNYLFNPYK